MEEQDLQSVNEEQSKTGLIISTSATNYLTETAKWAKFLSIIGFIFTGLTLILGLFAESIISSMSYGQIPNTSNGMEFMFSGIYLLLGILYFFPSWYLLKFSQKMKLALSIQNNDELNTAFSNHKSFYKFLGITYIVIIGIYVLLALIALVASI
jgi:hypothetical protein